MRDVRRIYSAEPPPQVPEARAIEEAEYAIHCCRLALDVVCSELDPGERKHVRDFLDSKYPGFGQFIGEREP